MAVSLLKLQMLHKYLCIACRHPFPDEDVVEMRRRRRLIAEMIAECM
jgi:hypothetical protein